MRVRRLILGMLDTNCWLVDAGPNTPVIIVDPGDSAPEVLGECAGAPVAAIALTHGHFDHIGAVRELVGATGAPLLVHETDAASLLTPEGAGGAVFGMPFTAPPAERLLSEGDIVAAGSVRLEVLHTPGHTPGSICLLGDGHLISGDTLFAGSVGRTDFPGGDMRAMQRSIARLASLADDVRVHPGHGPDTTIGRERRINPFFPRA